VQWTRNHANNHKGEVRHSQITQRLLQLCSLGRFRTTGRQDRHHHEAHDGGIGSYGDKRARETNIQIGLLGSGVSQEKSCHRMQQQQQQQKKEKKKQRRPTDRGPPL